MAAPVIVAIRNQSKLTLGVLAKRQKYNDRRFRRLLNCRDREELVEHIKRLIKFCGQEGNVEDIINTIRYWGQNQRQKLARDFYGGDDDFVGEDS